jgi:hypothetical protein
MAQGIKLIFGIVLAAVGVVVFLSLVNLLQDSPDENDDWSAALRQYNDTLFRDLPPKERNFSIIKRDFYDNQIRDLSKISPNIYKRPEFYPTWERNYNMWYLGHDYTRWGVHGYGIFPSEIQYSVINMSAGDVLNIYTFIKTSWGIETWQGLKLNVVYNTTLFNAEAEPDLLLLEPTFPHFYYNWTRLVKIKVTAKEKIPQGQYRFGITVSSPPEDVSEIWLWDVLDRYTDNEYHDQIAACKNRRADNCDELIKIRQNKYVSAGMFTPSSLFTAVITASE